MREELDAVVVIRVVARGDHHAGVAAHVGGEEGHRRASASGRPGSRPRPSSRCRRRARPRTCSRRGACPCRSGCDGCARPRAEHVRDRLPELERHLRRHRPHVGGAAHAVGAEESRAVAPAQISPCPSASRAARARARVPARSSIVHRHVVLAVEPHVEPARHASSPSSRAERSRRPRRSFRSAPPTGGAPRCAGPRSAARAGSTVTSPSTKPGAGSPSTSARTLTRARAAALERELDAGRRAGDDLRAAREVRSRVRSTSCSVAPGVRSGEVDRVLELGDRQAPQRGVGGAHADVDRVRVLVGDDEVLGLVARHHRDVEAALDGRGGVRHAPEQERGDEGDAPCSGGSMSMLSASPPRPSAPGSRRPRRPARSSSGRASTSRSTTRSRGASSPRIISPPITTEIAPVSSDTTTTTASRLLRDAHRGAVARADALGQVRAQRQRQDRARRGSRGPAGSGRRRRAAASSAGRSR